MSRSRSRSGSQRYSRSRSGSQSRSRSRSRTPSRRRRRQRSYDSYYSNSDYSDSFYSDDGSSHYQQSKKTQKKDLSNKSGAAGKVKKPGGRNSKAQKSPRGGGVVMDSVTKRMLSARRNRINELKNRSEEMASLVNELKLENKALKRQQKLQDRALDKYESQENDMSTILDRHNNELSAAKEQIKRYRDRSQKSDKKLRETEFELDRTRKLVKKLRELVDDKELQERDELSRKLSKAESELDKRTQRVQDLERHIEHLKKNHRHEFGIERAREKEAQKQLEMLQEENDRLKMNLREKEKELEVANIYRFRAMKPPHRLNSSVRSSPVPNGPLHSRQRKNSDSSILTPRERAKHYEKHRRQRQKPRPVATLQPDRYVVSEEPPRQSEPMMQSPSCPALQQSSHLQFSFMSHKTQQPKHDSGEESVDWHSPTNTQSEQKHTEKLGSPKQEAKPSYQRKPSPQPMYRAQSPDHSQPKTSPPEQVVHKPPPKPRSPSPQLLTLTDEPVENESNAGYSSLKKQTRDTREEEKPQSPVLLQLDEQPIAKQKSPVSKTEPVKQSSKEDVWKFTTEPSEPHDSPLPWMKPKSEPEPISAPPVQAENDEKAELNRRKKDQLLARLRVIDEQKSHTDKERTKYSVSKPVENMHHGLPAYDDVTVPVLEKIKRRKSLASDSDSDTGYKPSFLGSNEQKPSKKAGLVNGDISIPRNKSKGKNDLSWLNSGSRESSSGQVRPVRESSSAALAGGAALFDDDPAPQTNRHLLPRRPRQTAQTITTRPTFTAVDTVDDDLEEVLI